MALKLKEMFLQLVDSKLDKTKKRLKMKDPRMAKAAVKKNTQKTKAKKAPKGKQPAAKKRPSKPEIKAKAPKAPAKKELSRTPNKKGAKPSKPAAAEKPAAPAKRVVLGPITPGRLGEKRNCLKCHTKFYDFERTPITCPKCFAEFGPEDFEVKIVLKSDSKKARAPEKEEEPERELVVSDAGEDFESLEDLNDDDSAVVGIESGKESDESFD
ncbi:MAG: hypothetical protein EBQ85_04155 [Proteobacteria bacterium]|nr:hypothetical protein [Pseudomonadota bacterium]